MRKTPPGLLARTLTVTFVTVAVILTVVFVVITFDVRDRVRAAETEKLRVSENVFTALESKRQQDQVAAMATLAENPTLKAALDTYFTERRFSGSSDDQLRATVTGEAEKPRKTAEIIDLMSVLKQSLEKGGRGGHARKSARRATARHRRKAARG